MPYKDDGSDVPAHVKGKKKRRQWAHVWNSSYESHHDEARAFASANSVAGKALVSFLAKIRGIDTPYEDTGEYDFEEEQHLIEELGIWADYAEDGPTYDPTGKYLCGTCDMRLGDADCMRVVSPINFETGSCRIYTHGYEPENEPPMPVKLTQIEAAYTERPNVKGFGCIRCQYGGEAKKADPAGRPSWCSFWGVHVWPKACCFMNTGSDDVFAPVKGSGETEKREKTMVPTASKSVTKDDVQIFCPLVKVDEAKREVWGVVTAELPDKDSEICDYASTVPYYKEVVDEMAKATDGQNIFPLRAMHGLVAAGKGISIEFRDDAKEVYMGFKVVDDAEWKKVQENVYTGFSQGGRYIKKWQDGDNVRYTAKPGEVSLVDMPCLTRAHFEYVKADKTIEIRKFAGAAAAAAVAGGQLSPRPVKKDGEAEEVDTSTVDGKNKGCECGCAACKGGNCKGCTAETKCMGGPPPQKAVKYLVTESDGTTHLPYTGENGKPNHRLMGAAWAALHGGYRGNKYEGPSKQAAIKRLKQVYAREGMETPAEKALRIEPELNAILETVIQSRAYGQLGKGMYSVGRFAQIVEEMKYLWIDLEYERAREDDESPATDDLKAFFTNLLDVFLAYTEEQVEELSAHAAAFEPGGLAMSQQTADLLKAASASLASHFKKAAAHHEAMAGYHEKIASAHAAHSDFHGTAAEGDSNKAYHKTSAAFHKSMSGHHSGLHKRHAAHADHLHKMSAAHAAGDAAKVLKLSEVEPEFALPPEPVITPAPTSDPENKMNAELAEALKAMEGRILAKLEAKVAEPPTPTPTPTAAPTPAPVVATPTPTPEPVIVKTFPVGRPGEGNSLVPPSVQITEGVDPQFASLCSME